MTQALSFTQGPVGRQIYRLTLPGVWGLLCTLSFNTIDTLFVGQLGSDALAAMSFTFPVALLVTTLAVSFATGASSVYARMLGLDLRVQARRMVADTLMLTGIISTVIMLVGWWTLKPTFLLLGAPPELLPLIEAYIWPWYINAPLFAFSSVISAVMQASGHTRMAGLLMVGTALINLVLDPLLIFGWGPVPGLGIAGAAWTTVITRVLLVVAGLYMAIVRYNLISMPNLTFAALLRSWRSVMHIGLPAMGAGIILPVSATVTLTLVASYGPDAVAALGVAQRIEPMVLIVFLSLSGIMGPFFGQNMSEALRPRQREAAQLVLKFSLIYALVIAIILALGGPYIGSWFTDSPEVTRIIALYLLITPIGYGLSGVAISVTSCFNGVGRPLPGMVVSMLRVLGLYAPLVLLGQWLWGLEGIFIGTTLSNILAGIIAHTWLMRTLNKPAAVGV